MAQKAAETAEFKSCPNRYMPVSQASIPGAILIGDALNMRHPLTGGGMTVALKDVVALSRQLQVSLSVSRSRGLCS